jgi:hypothetical protein
MAMNNVFLDIYRVIWKEVFPNVPEMEVEQFRTLFTNDLALPVAHPCTIDAQQTVFSSKEYGYRKFISRTESVKRMEENNWKEDKKDIRSLADVLAHVQNVNSFLGSRQLNSDILEESDDIYSSGYIYGSTHIYNCQKMLFCYNNKESEFLMACKGNASCGFSIRVHDSNGVSNSFDIHWCGKTANSYFCHDCYDLRDCMFCFHLNSKQYCIANMQFEKEEYLHLKEMILTEYFKQLNEPNGFRTLADL